MQRIKYWRVLDVAAGNESHITSYQPKHGEEVWTLCERGFPFLGNPGAEEITEATSVDCAICVGIFEALEADEEGGDLP